MLFMVFALTNWRRIGLPTASLAIGPVTALSLRVVTFTHVILIGCLQCFSHGTKVSNHPGRNLQWGDLVPCEGQCGGTIRSRQRRESPNRSRKTFPEIRISRRSKLRRLAREQLR